MTYAPPKWFPNEPHDGLVGKRLRIEFWGGETADVEITEVDDEHYMFSFKVISTTNPEKYRRQPPGTEFAADSQNVKSYKDLEG